MVSKLLFLAANSGFESGENEINPFLESSLILSLEECLSGTLMFAVTHRDHNALFSSQEENPQSPPVPLAPAPPL